MTHDDAGRGHGDAPLAPPWEASPLDAQLRALPLDVAPGRDLWPEIEARIGQAPAMAAPRSRRPAWVWQAAAAVILVAGSSLLTATLLDRRATPAQAAQPPVPARSSGPQASVENPAVMPAAFGPSGRLDHEYLAARQQLTSMLDERIAALPPSARAKLEFNLGEMRRAADEINAALAAQPGDPLLEELLLKTYQDELAVLSNVSELTNSLGRTQAPAGEKRMQL